MDYYDYSKMSKDDCLDEVQRLKKERPDKWRWAVKGICSHLAALEGINSREHPREVSDQLGRKCRNPKMLGGAPF